MSIVSSSHVFVAAYSDYLLIFSEVVKTDFRESSRHYTVDLFDKHLVPIGSIRIYLDGGCRLLGDSSDEAMLVSPRRLSH